MGKLLRIDVDNMADGNNYAIPTDNPFVENPDALDEIWAYGLRNPWRFSFDSTTNDLWIADVGQGDIEEINKAGINAAGLNYGWRCYEGSEPYNTSDCPDPSELTFPIAEYTHSGGNCSITGGYVYRGTTYTDISGLYFYADYCSGDIGTVDDAFNLINHGNFGDNWSSFGEDINGELYIAGLSGSIYKISGGEIFDTADYINYNFTMLPNPASDSLSLSISNNLISTITIFDIKGTEVVSESNVFASEKTIAIQSLTTGIYIVKIIVNNGQSIIKKLLVK